MRHLLSLKEQSREELLEIISLAQKLKAERAKGKLKPYLAGKTLIMLFQKASTRTRLSFEAGMTELGGHAIYLDARTSQLSIAEFRDEIRAIMRFGQVLMFRSLKSADVELAASFNQVPVIDALSEKYHPCQALGDMLTMIENTKGGLKNLKKIAWLGIENNVSNTLKLLCAKLGVEIAIISPEANPASVDKELNKLADATGKVLYTKSLAHGLKDAQFVHTDTWIDMEFFENGKVLPSFKKELNRRVKTFMPYQLNMRTLESYAPKAKIMHCMACHIDYEITREAVEHKNSLIFDQAENRMHIQKAIIMWLLDTRYQKKVV